MMMISFPPLKHKDILNYKMFKQGFRSAFRVASRQFSTARPYKQFNNSSKGGLFKKGLIAGVIGYGGYYLLNNQTNFATADVLSKIKTPDNTEYFEVTGKVNKFPSEYSLDGEKYTLLGSGVRSVSFLGINVYAVGMYIAEKDLPKVKQVLDGYTEEQLLNPETGGELISLLLSAGVKLDIRIVPVRNTDCGHLRDGIVRKIMQHPRFKEEGNNEHFGSGLQELKQAFGRKMSIPKNKVLHMTRDADGVMNVAFYKADKEDDISAIDLGNVKNSLVTEFLFLQYLSGNNPSSEGLRQSAVKSLAELSK